MKLKTTTVTMLLCLSGVAFGKTNIVQNGYTIVGDAAKQIINHFPWEDAQIEYVSANRHLQTKYVFTKQYGYPIISCIHDAYLQENSAQWEAFSCLLTADVASQSDSFIEFYSPDYSWCDKESFFYKLANHIPGHQASPCYAPFDYGPISGWSPPSAALHGRYDLDPLNSITSLIHSLIPSR